MSNILKSIGRAIKKIVKSPIFKAILVAAAVYFTGGLAAGAMGSAFAVGLPGISAAANALGITAGAFGAAGELAAGAGIASMSGLSGIDAVMAGESVAAGGLSAEAMGAGSAAMAAGNAAITDASLGAAGAVNSAEAMAGATDASLGAAGSINAANAATAGLAQPTTGLIEQGLATGVAGEGAPALTMPFEPPAPIVPEPMPIAPSVNAAPASSGVSETLNAGAGSEAGASAVGKAAGSSIKTNLFTDFGKWWGELSPESKTILGQAGLGAGKAVVGAIASKSQTDESRRQFDSSHGVPAPTKPSPYNGLVNSMFSNPAQRPVIGGA